MSLFICSLNSGSNGNCYYIGNETEAIIVDTGLTCRETEKRMRRAGLAMEKVKAIFITHEHGDHIKGLKVLSAKHRLPVYITPRTLQHSRLKLNRELVIPFQAFEPIIIHGLTVHTFPKFHDAADPHSVVIEGNGVKIGVFTDIGTPCQHITDHFKQCHAAFLEANYDDDMLDKGRYPHHLKNRIRGNEGHLSNLQALELFTKHRSASMSHLLLSHLSKDNNCPELVSKLFNAYANNTQIIVASRYEETGVYQVSATTISPPAEKKKINSRAHQMSLF